MKRYTLFNVDKSLTSVLSYVDKAMTECDYSLEEREAFTINATSEGYEHLIDSCSRRLKACNQRLKEKEQLEGVIK